MTLKQLKEKRNQILVTFVNLFCYEELTLLVTA